MKIFNFLIVLLAFNIFAQEPQEPTEDELRNDEINVLLELVKTNKSIYVNEDNIRLKSFLDRVAERTILLNDAKIKLKNENDRNKRLEANFE